MEVRQAADVIRRLGSQQASEAWEEFLCAYSPIILQVVHLFERDPDHAGDCFLFVCERLCEKRFRRLRAFRPEGPAALGTWLRAVVRNLCLDWHRQEFGRQRIFQSIARLQILDQEVFRCRYEQGLTSEETLLTLMARHSSLTAEQLARSEERIRESLSPRQLWLLSTQRPRVESLEGAIEDDAGAFEDQVPDPRPNPEQAASQRQERAALQHALECLPASDRLMIRFRFEQGLTLERIARLARLRDAQSADRAIRDILRRLREALTRIEAPGGKRAGESV